MDLVASQSLGSPTQIFNIKGKSWGIELLDLFEFGSLQKRVFRFMSRQTKVTLAGYNQSVIHNYFYYYWDIPFLSVKELHKSQENAIFTQQN